MAAFASHGGAAAALPATGGIAASDPDSPASRYLSVVVPAYNEEGRLGAMLTEAIEYLQKREADNPAFTWEVIVVDDGSQDRTGEVALAFARRLSEDCVRLLRLPMNCGKGFAVREGMLCARGQLLLMADADGATRFSDLHLLEACFHGQGDPAAAPLLAAGSRAHLQRAAVARRSWHRNLLMRAFHLLVVLVIGGAVRDTQCGFKLLGRRTGKRLFRDLKTRRWAFDVELLHLAQRTGVRAVEVPVAWTEIGGSKMRVTGILQMAKELVLIRLMYALGFWTVHTR
mmetsp:Transcript_19170/g.64220  ORF Transcript_19170/g.64220 Transcript_19170/m.64220 type:complete len:286 (-) Transcript_19170:358-1215(-)